MKFSIKDFFSKCDQIHRKLRIWSHLLKKSLMENFIFLGSASLFMKKDFQMELYNLLAKSSLDSYSVFLIQESCIFQKQLLKSCSVKKVFFGSPQNSQENTCEACTFLKREALAQVFSCEFCEISKNTFFIEHLCWLLLHFWSLLCKFSKLL